MKLLRLAADTNVLLDLADKVESVVDALAVVDERLSQPDKLVTPSVLDQLAYLCDSGWSSEIRALAQRAISQLRQEHGFRPFVELPFSSETIENVAREIRRDGLLPAEEIHDSRILAEAVLLNCGILLTSDEHLRSIEHEAMTLTLKRLDLAPPVITTPREIVRKFSR
jgi:predicted nucleic acid-binding protein